MQQAPTILVILLDLAALLSAYLAAWAQLRSRVPAAQEFACMTLGSGFYALGYAIEISRTSLSGMLEAVRIEYLGLAFVPAFVFLFAYHFTRGEPAPVWLKLAVLAIPVSTLVMVFTLEHHNLYYINPHVVEGDMFPMLSFERGIWYKVNFTYQQTIVVLAIIVLLIYTFRDDVRRRKQALVISIAIIIPILSATAYALGWIPGKIDSGPYALTLTFLLSAYAVFKLGLFDLIPAARELALDSIRDGFLVVDKYGRLQDLNRAAWFLPDAEEFKLGAVLPPENSFVKQIQPLIKENVPAVQFTTRDDKSFSAKAYPILNEYPLKEGTAIVISDITETALLMNQLKLQADIDELTGIYNRRQLLQLGELALAKLRNQNLPLAAILIDLDHFKLINDAYGHAAGDEVLRQVVKCFRTAIRSVDILGRYGGEEFVVFLPEIDLKTAAQIAQRLADLVDTLSIPYHDKLLSISASFGVHVVIPDNQTSMDDILQAADKALYFAKRNGRNQVALAE